MGVGGQEKEEFLPQTDTQEADLTNGSLSSHQLLFVVLGFHLQVPELLAHPGFYGPFIGTKIVGEGEYGSSIHLGFIGWGLQISLEKDKVTR